MRDAGRTACCAFGGFTLQPRADRAREPDDITVDFYLDLFRVHVRASVQRMDDPLLDVTTACLWLDLDVVHDADYARNIAHELLSLRLLEHPVDVARERQVTVVHC